MIYNFTADQMRLAKAYAEQIPRECAALLQSVPHHREEQYDVGCSTEAAAAIAELLLKSNNWTSGAKLPNKFTGREARLLAEWLATRGVVATAPDSPADSPSQSPPASLPPD